MNIKHQLNIHLDYGPSTFERGGLEVRYGYHFSGEHQLSEQVLRISRKDIQAKLRSDLTDLYSLLERRIPDPIPVRLPHAEISPTIRPTGLTFVVLDQKRADRMPIARLYFLEEVEEIGSRIEKKIYLEKPDWAPAELPLCDRITRLVRKLAWEDYERLVGHHLFE